MKLWKRSYSNSDFLQALLSETIVTKETVMELPYLNGCINMISNIIAGLPIKLYKEQAGSVEEVTDDQRVRCLNDDTGDLLDGYTFKKNMIIDYLLYGEAYAYINRNRNKVQSLHYIENNYVTVMPSVDPIFKDASIHILGGKYRYFDFVTLAKNTPNGMDGKGLVDENKEIITLSYKMLKYQRKNVETGGIKKGVIKSEKKLNEDALKKLKDSWKNLYGKDSEENCIILNEGLDYKDLANTPLEMQMDEMFKSIKDQLCSLINTPPTVLDGTATENTYQHFIKLVIIPIINAFEAALNHTLLLENEKGVYYYAFDTKELLKGDIEKRYKAYEIGVKNGFLQIDEVRYKEDLNPLGLDFIKLGLADVLYNPTTKEIYTPNTNQKVNMEGLKGGDTDADSD